MTDTVLPPFSSLPPCSSLRSFTSIIIPMHDRWDLTSVCLDSVRRYTTVPYEVILVDDASPAQASEAAVQFIRDWRNDSNAAPISLIVNRERLSFSRNNNQAAAKVKGEFLCLLNNDTVVSPGWLEGMLAVARAETKLGVVGNKHLFPDNGLLHHCGLGFDESFLPLHLHPHTDPNLPAANYQRELQAVSFACVLIPATVYQQLGGLEESFHTSYEDIDFCLRARAAGLKVIYTPASVIVHHGQSTPGRKLNDAKNKEVFLERWRGRVECDLRRLTTEGEAFNASALAIQRVSPKFEEGVHLGFDISQGNSFAWVAAELALALTALGERVSLPLVKEISPSFSPEKRAALAPLMKTAPYKTFHVKLNHYWDSYFRQPIHGEINAEYFLTNYRFRTNPDDLDRWMRHVVASGHRKIAPSGFCKDCLTDVGVPEREIGVVPLGYSPEIDQLFPIQDASPNRSGGPLKLLAITNSFDIKRMGSDLLIAALAEAFGPDDDVVVHIHDYGAASGNKSLKELVAQYPKFPKVIWHEEFLPKDALLRFISQMDAVLAPFRGEGFSMKVLDCFALGVPVMMPAFSGVLEFAAPGTFIPLPHKEVPLGECYDTEHFDVGPGAYWCEVSHSEFVAELRRALGDRAELAAIGAAARAHVRGRFSWDSAAKTLMATLRRWQAERLSSVSLSAGPAKQPLSVLIPTKDRLSVLEETLRAYTLQTIDKDEFEVVVVNDHGKLPELAALVDEFRSSLNITLVDNTDVSGPAGARNFGLRHVSGEVVFITGDDIVPTPELLERHRAAHVEFPQLEVGFIGRCPWHPAVSQSWMMEHIIGRGAQQFDYSGLLDREEAPFERLYTSNLSLKRRFITDLERPFDPIFRFAALEDIEAAHRLRLRGLQLRFLDRAVGYHRHEMTVRDFLERQRRVGRMLKVFCDVQPSYAPREYSDLVRWCDAEYRRRREGGEVTTRTPPTVETLLELLVRTIESIDAWTELDFP
jgi:GT2 family glycosyltransferase/glycosyltransferase involved in cell wall biosynthesis